MDALLANLPEPDQPELRDRLIAAAERVHTALGGALDVVIPNPRRPHDLVTALGLDKTLASRICRTAASSPSLEAVLDGAGIQGLRLTAEALRAAAVKRSADMSDVEAIAALESAVADFAEVCDEFPDGRIGLETAMADLLPELRDHSERRARRALWNAHSFLLGLSQEVLYKAFIRVPSREEPDLVDQIYIEVCQGFRLLRAGSRAPLIGLLVIRADEQSKVRSETINGEVMSQDPVPALLLEKSSKPLPPLAWEVRGQQVQVMMGENFPVLSAPVTLTMAQVHRNAMRRYGRADSMFDTNYAVLRKPTRTMVWDQLTHLSLGAGPPELTASFASPAGPIPKAPSEDRTYAIRQPEQFQSLGVGLARIATSDVPDCRGLLTHVLERLDIDPSALGVHRLRIEYPIAHTRYVAWTRLMTRPG